MTKTKTRKITIKQSLAQIAGKGPKAYPHYIGAPIQATPGQVYKRVMPELKNCLAECFLMIDETNRRYTFANVYQGRLRNSYRPEKYTYDLTEKALGKLLTKIEEQGFAEVPPTEWDPTWLVPVVKPLESKPARRGRKDAK